MMQSPGTENRALRYISELVYERCRIRLDAGKQALIKARLGKHLRHHGFEDLAEYCRFLQTEADEDEFTRVVDALTTNFTFFMREPDHFRFLVETAFQEALVRGETAFRVWSAACSSGEEPYTIAFFLADCHARYPGHQWSVAASDISTHVLRKARAGIYEDDRVSSLPREWLRRYFQKGSGRWEGFYRVKRSISDRIAFRQINLTGSYAHPHVYQVIFCRNVMIYLDRPTQEQLVLRLRACLAPQGYLIIGHSESLNGLSIPLRCVRPSIYQNS